MALPHRRQQALTNAFHMFNQLRDPAQRSWILMNPTSLGDTMLACALLKSFREKYGGPITMVVPDKQVPLAKMYAHRIERIVAIPFAQLESLCVEIAEAQVFCMGQPYIVHPFWHGEGRWEHFIELFKYPKRGGVSFSDLFRHILHLGWDTPLEPPVIPDEWRKEAEIYAEQAGLEPGNSVILFPDNNSNPAFPSGLWEPLAEELNRRGKKVFTNLAGNAKGPRAEPFGHTTGINIPLHLAIPLIEIAGRYISGNNGLITSFLIARARSEGTVLIYNKSFQLNDYIAKDPITFQSYRYMGFTDDPPTEYLIDPDQDYTPYIADIAANNPKTALAW
jgi:hypothetical protein